jgi:effector-binding domain-containing protein
MRRPLRAVALAVALTLAAAPAAFAQSPPSAAEPPPPPQQAQSPGQNGDPFGEELTLAPKTVIYLKGQANWDSALESLIDAFKSVYAFLDKEGIKRAGPSMTIYTQADDTGFQFQAAVPIETPPSDPPKGDMALGQSPAGKALKFVHRGSYDSMDSTYEAITNYLDEKRLEAEEVFIEEYQTDPVTTPDEKFVVFVYVPIK